MSTWRTLGYVPDSDDEEDSLNTRAQHVRDEAADTEDRHLKAAFSSINEGQNTHTAPSIGTATSSTETQLEAVLSQGLRSVRDIIADASPATAFDDDSPLSSLVSSIASSPTNFVQQNHSIIENVPEDRDESPATPNEYGVLNLPRRSLRARAPIQEHPYMLEDAKYRQLMQDRGLKPINVPSAPLNREQDPAGEDSQQTETFSSSPPPEESSNFNVPSSPPSVHSTQGDQHIQNIDLAMLDTNHDEDEDDLLDLSQILSARHHPKKTNKTKGQQTQAAQQHSLTRLKTTQASDTLGQEEPKAFRVPPSPPRSEGNATSDSEITLANPKFKKHSNTPRILPTPLVSSNSVSRKRHVIIDSSSDAAETTEEEIEQSLIPSPQDDEDDSQGIRWIRNRLKGILPPSFLRLDIPGQTNKQKKQSGTEPSATPVNERGVARRTNSRYPGSARQDINNIVELQDSDSSDLEVPTASEVLGSNQSDVPQDLLPIAASKKSTIHVAEEDEIDRMLPSTGGHRRRNTTKSSRQSRIDDGWAASHSRNANASAAAGLTRRNGRASRPNKTLSNKKHRKVKNVLAAPVMNILDAPGFRELEKDAQPRFLKLAARQARKSVQRHQHDAPRKFFLLATEDDTQDVIAAWQNWSTKSYGRRMPLDPSSENVSIRTTSGSNENSPHGISHASATSRRTYSPSHADLASLKRSTSALLTRVSAMDKHQTLSHADALATAQTVQQVAKGELHAGTSQLKSLFAHRNRSGGGQLLARSSNPRSAQTETIGLAIRPVSRLPIRPSSKPSNKVRNVSNLSGSASATKIEVNRTAGLPAKRKPKKQTPHKSAIPTADAIFANPPRSPQTVNHRTAIKATVGVADEFHATATHKYLASRAHAHVEALKFLPLDTLFRHNIIGSAALDEVLERFDNDAYDPTIPRPFLWPISTSITNQSKRCGRYDAEVYSYLTTTLDELCLTLSGEVDLFASADQPTKCIESVASIVLYFNRAVFFQSDHTTTLPQELSQFIRGISHQLERLIQQTSCQHEPSRGLTSTTLSCLNWCLLLALHLHILSRSTEPDLQSQTQKLCLSIIRRVLSIMLDPDHLLRSLEFLETYVTPHDLYVFDQSFPEAESMVIAWHICRKLDAGASAQQLYMQMQSAIVEKTDSHWIITTTLTLLALCFLLPFTRVTALGYAVPTPHEAIDADGSCFGLLAMQLSSLGTRVQSGRAPLAVGQLLEALEDLCLKMVKTWLWSPPPAIATALLRAYTWNAMLPFNTTPTSEEVFVDVDCLSAEPTTSSRNNDFLKFLELVRLCMNTLCHQPDPRSGGRDYVPSPSKVRGFVFSLIPNNARTFDAQFNVHADQVLALKNHFSLYITLFTCAPPGFQPRMEQLEQQVDFTTSHSFVCKLATATWKAIALAFVERVDPGDDNLDNISRWMNSMLSQSIVCLELYRQFEAMHHIEDLLKTFTEVVNRCNSEPKARRLLTANPQLSAGCFETIGRLLSKPELHRNNEKIMIAGLKLLHTYLLVVQGSTPNDSLVSEVQLILRQVMQETLSNRRVNNGEMVRALMSAWFVAAQIMVRTFHKHWNDYLEPHSSLSIDFLAGLRNSYAAYEAKQVFYSDLIQADQSFFFLECRPLVFMTWVASLLLPIHSMRFNHILTNNILKYERDSLMIKDLAASLHRYHNGRDLTVQDTLDARVIILRHIIQNIYGQQGYPEEEWLAGGLDSTAQLELLRTMTKTMKSIWYDLKISPVEQNDYTELVHAILNEMETYPVQGFKIDSWFTSSEFPRPPQTLDNIFKCRFGEHADVITKSVISNFRAQFVHEIKSGREERMLADLIRVFHCTDRLRVRQNGDIKEYSIDIPKQTQFIQLVFPAYIESTIPCLMDPILSLLIVLTKSLQFRIDNLDPNNMRLFVETTTTMLCAVRNALGAIHLEHQSAAELVRYARLATKTVFNLAEYGTPIDEGLLEIFVGNVLSIYAFVRVHLHSASALDSETFLLPRALEQSDVWTDPPCEQVALVPEELEWTLHADPAEPDLNEQQRQLRNYAREELKGLEGLIGVKEKECDRWDLQEEMLGFVRELVARQLVPETFEETDSDEVVI